jgi:hypothetical protein
MGCGNSQPKVGAVAVKNPVPSSPPGATKQGSATATELLTAAALKSKRRGNVMAERQEVDHAYVPRNVPKDAHARTLIQTALRDNILFASIGEGASMWWWRCRVAAATLRYRALGCGLMFALRLPPLLQARLPR